MSEEEQPQKPSPVENLIETVKAKADDIAWHARNSTIARAASDRRWSVQEGLENSFKGWCDADIVNLGDRLVEHYAELLSYLSQCDYDDAEDGYKEKLREIAESLHRYCSAVDEAGMLGRIDGIGTKANPYNPPVIAKAIENMSAQFERQWDWIGENILCAGFHMPAGIVPPDKDQAIHVKSYYKTVGEKVSSKAVSVRDAVERAVSENRFSKRDVSKMPTSELDRLSDMLYQFASSSIGCPDSYRGSGDELRTRDASWDDRQALSSSMFGNPGIANDLINVPTQSGTVTIAKNKVDADYNAWTEDITYAADVVKTWREWAFGADSVKESLVQAGAGEAQVSELDEKMQSEFLRVWKWIGKNVPALWV